MDFYLDDVSVIAEEYVDPNDLILNGGFEDGTENWAYQDPCTVTAVTEDKASGSMAVKITDRTTTLFRPQTGSHRKNQGGTGNQSFRYGEIYRRPGQQRL